MPAISLKYYVMQKGTSCEPVEEVMGIQETETPLHWNFLLALEDDMATLSRFIEPTEGNHNAYSLELARMLFAASSEVDVVAKQLCAKIDDNRRAKCINDYRAIITAEIPKFYQTEVLYPRFGLKMKPWLNWEGDKNPLWWRAYNDVKHERNAHFPKANLKNALNSVAALYVLLLFFYQSDAEQGKLSPNPSLLRAGEPFILDSLFWSQERTIVYKFDNFK